jgi:hypothetical protein
MPLVRVIIATRPNVATPVADAFSNTLYFNVSGSIDNPDYQAIVNDLWTLWTTSSWGLGRYCDVRAYNMDDPEPRPVKAAKKQQAASGTPVIGVPQVALALSYYCDRNLPRQRGRIFLGPFNTNVLRPSQATIDAVADTAIQLGAIGGVNVDWSLWSPTTQTHTRIDHAWCDDSWDVIRSRKLKATTRAVRTLNG